MVAFDSGQSDVNCNLQIFNNRLLLTHTHRRTLPNTRHTATIEHVSTLNYFSFLKDTCYDAGIKFKKKKKYKIGKNKEKYFRNQLI